MAKGRNRGRGKRKGEGGEGEEERQRIGEERGSMDEADKVRGNNEMRVSREQGAGAREGEGCCR